MICPFHGLLHSRDNLLRMRGRRGVIVRTALVCVRTPLAAQSVASCASRLGVTTIRTAVSETEALARLAEAPAELVLADTAITRPDTVGFTRRVLARAPRAVLVLLGPEEPRVAAAAVSAGARGLIRGSDQDLVGTVAKVLLLISGRRPAGEPMATLTGRGQAGLGPTADSGPRPAPGAVPASPGPTAPGKPAGGTAGVGRLGPGASGGVTAGSGRVEPPAGYSREGDPSAESAAGRDAAGRGSGGTAVVVPSQRVDPVTGADRRRPALTERELQVLRGMAEGKSNAEIGRDLYVSEDTVKTHARRLFRKLRARDRAHAVAVGFRSGALS